MNFEWILKYGTTKFLSHHINLILVEACDAFKVSVRTLISDSVDETKIPPLIPTELTINTQVCPASVNVPSCRGYTANFCLYGRLFYYLH